MAAGGEKVGFAVKVQVHSWSAWLSDDANKSRDTYRWWGGRCWSRWASRCRCWRTWRWARGPLTPASWSRPRLAGTAETRSDGQFWWQWFSSIHYCFLSNYFFATKRSVMRPKLRWRRKLWILKWPKSIGVRRMNDRADSAQLRYNLHCPRLEYQSQMLPYYHIVFQPKIWTSKISSSVWSWCIHQPLIASICCRYSTVAAGDYTKAPRGVVVHCEGRRGVARVALLLALVLPPLTLILNTFTETEREFCTGTLWCTVHNNFVLELADVTAHFTI